MVFRTLARNRVVAVVTAVVLAALVAFEVQTVLGGSVPSAPGSTLGVVRRFAVAVTSFDYRHVHSEVVSIEAMGTSGFRQDFIKAMGPHFITNIVKNQTVSTAQLIAGPTLQRVVGHVAQFFVLLDESVTSTSSTASGSSSSPTSIQVGLLVDVEETSNLVRSVQVF